ncbi:hypothetical protein M0802_010824, partial [Mischocyttarus mexicanus]
SDRLAVDWLTGWLVGWLDSVHTPLVPPPLLPPPVARKGPYVVPRNGTQDKPRSGTKLQQQQEQQFF